MKKVKIVSPEEVEVRAFVLSEFVHNQTSDEKLGGVTKKALKCLAKKLDLAYDDTQIMFAKKLLNAYLREECR